MDADWGSSSDEETVADREARDAKKRVETMALLEAFEKTREAVKIDYGSTGDAGKKFRDERSQAAGRAIWEERRSRAGVEKQEEQEIQGAMKYHIILGLIIIAVLGFALFGVYDTLGGVLAESSNTTNTTGGGAAWQKLHPNHPQAKSKGLPPLKVVLFAVFLGVSIPTCFLVRRQLRANKTKSFQGHFHRGVDYG